MSCHHQEPNSTLQQEGRFLLSRTFMVRVTRAVFSFVVAVISVGVVGPTRKVLSWIKRGTVRAPTIGKNSRMVSFSFPSFRRKFPAGTGVAGRATHKSP